MLTKQLQPVVGAIHCDINALLHMFSYVAHWHLDLEYYVLENEV